MKKISSIIGITALVVGLLYSCKKSSTPEKTTVSTPPFQIGQIITSGNLPAGSYKGTMQSGNTYTLTGNFTINIGDTVFMQPGSRICVGPGVTIIVKGVFISMGTQANQNWITSCSASKIDLVGNPPSSDPAYSGIWTGINCDTSCRLLDIQWTHIEFAGGTFPTTEPFVGGTSGNASFNILFQNPKGDLIMTDSWVYGGVDDCIRIQQGRIYIARNTFEKIGLIGGDGVNAKHGSQGDMCYNLFIGSCTNSTKCSDKGTVTACECNINMYNNTYIDCGYRQASPSSRGSDIDYEQGGEGLCYNNLIVNCRNGIRIGDGQNSIPMPDTAHVKYSNNYIYADSMTEVNQFFPIQAGTWTKPTAYILPTNAELNLPTGFYRPPYDDSTYSAPAAAAGENNPMFVNFPLPEPIPSGQSLAAISSIATGVVTTGSNFNFHLQSGSPAAGKGYTGFSAFQNILNPVISDITNPNYAPTVTQPGIDIGCYQINGSGNQH